MKDGELRGIVLEKFYELRNRPDMVNVPSLPEMVALDSDPYRLVRICEHLGEKALIEWESVNSHSSVGGFGKITAYGVDVIEGTTQPPFTMALHDHRISISHSSNVQIGNSNTINQGLGKLPVLAKLVADLTEHLDELNLDARQKRRAEAQISVIKTEIEGEPNSDIVGQAVRTLRNITEGAISSLLASAAQPAVWHSIHRMLEAVVASAA